MTVTDLFGKLFALIFVIAGIFIGYSHFGLKGAAGGIIAGYITGSIIFYFLVFLYTMIKDKKQRKKDV